MKEIKIKGIVAEGFRSLSERVEVNLARPGLNLVKGENGAGKTTLFEAVAWNVYGINLKGTTNEKIPTWEESRTEAFRGTYTETTLDIDGTEYKIVRTKDWSGGEGIGRDMLMIRDQNHSGVHKNKVQEQINNLLGIDAPTFMASILFGQRMPKLVESDNKDKRDLFETLFETAFINNGKVKASAKLVELTADYAKIEGEQLSLDTQKTTLYNEMNEQERLLEEFVTKKVENCDMITEEITTARNNISAIELESEGYNDQIADWNEEDYQKFKTEMDELERKYNALEETLKVPREAQVEASKRLGTASRADAVAETNVTQETKRTEKWVIDKAGDIVALQEELQGLINDRTDEIEAVNDQCYACKQDLPAESVKAVKDSINLNYDPQMSTVDTKLEQKKAETPPPSNLPELIITREETIKELSDAGEADIKARDAVEKAEKNGHEITSLFTDGTEKEVIRDKEAVEIGKMQGYVVENDAEIKVIEGKIEVMVSSLAIAQDEKAPKFSRTTTDMLDKIEGMEKELKDVDEKLKEIEYEMGLHQWWTKKGFSASGIPAFVFKGMLENLNEYVKPYSTRLGVSIEFSVDLTKASKPFTTVCSIGDKLDKDYKEFSGGQKQRLDIALVFAMHDLVSADSNIDMLIMDEVFEGLDEKGEAAVFDLVRMKVEEGKSIYIITHSPHIDSLYSSTMTAILDERGATTIAA